MTSTEFIFNLNTWALLRIPATQVLMFLLMYKLVKKRQPGLIDPFTLALFFFASGWAVVLELFLMKQCSPRLLITFIATNFAFLIGYLSIAPILTQFNSRPSSLKNFNHFGHAALAVYLFTATVNVALFGFGITHDNRLDIYSESSGLGILKRVLDAYMPVAVFFLTYLSSSRTGIKRVLPILALCLIATNTALDGSKSGLVAIFFAYTISTHWLQKSNLIYASREPTSSRWLWIAASFSIAFIVLGLQLGLRDDLSRVGDVIAVLFFRLTIAGDIFILGFPQEIIDKVPSPHNPMLVLFSDLLSTLRIWSGNIVPLGTELVAYVNPQLEGISGGPNSHISIYTYRLFGEIGGTFVSFLLGCWLGLIRKLYAKYIGNDPVMASLIIALLLNCSNMPIDPSYTMHRLTNIILLLTPLVLIFFKIRINKIETRSTSPKLAQS